MRSFERLPAGALVLAISFKSPINRKEEREYRKKIEMNLLMREFV